VAAGPLALALAARAGSLRLLGQLVGAVAVLLGNSADLLQNHRADLTINGIAEIAVALALLLWAAAPGESAPEAAA